MTDRIDPSADDPHASIWMAIEAGIKHAERIKASIETVAAWLDNSAGPAGEAAAREIRSSLSSPAEEPRKEERGETDSGHDMCLSACPIQERQHLQCERPNGHAGTCGAERSVWSRPAASPPPPEPTRRDEWDPFTQTHGNAPPEPEQDGPCVRLGFDEDGVPFMKEATISTMHRGLVLEYVPLAVAERIRVGRDAANEAVVAALDERNVARSERDELRAEVAGLTARRSGREGRMSKFTPGPWTASGPSVYEKDGRTVACCYTYQMRDTAVDHANARLIAAAPDLLDALARIVKAAEELTSWDWSRLLVDHPDSEVAIRDSAFLEQQLPAAKRLLAALADGTGKEGGR